MAKISEIHIGARFGRLTVTSEPFPVEQATGKRPRRVTVRCDCGTEKTARIHHLGSPVLSCGCILREKNSQRGLSGLPEYKVWHSMVGRCTKPAHHAWASYGGRGITVCEQWRESFETFLADMGQRPSAAYSIDRIDNDSGYSPDNCRWATNDQQARNRRTTKLNPASVSEIRRRLIQGHETQTALAVEYGVTRSAIDNIARGQTWAEIEPATL